MKELFLLVQKYLLKNEPLVLATVTESSGSTPRGSGAQMLVGKAPDGSAVRLWGSIGGGISEYSAIGEAGGLLSPGEPPGPKVSFKKYSLNPHDAAGLGAACGGEASVFFRSLDAAEPGLLELIEKGIACFGEQKETWLIMEACGDFSLGLAREDGFIFFTAAAPKNPLPLLKDVPVLVREDAKIFFSAPLVRSGFVYVFGGGHVAQELVPLLNHLEFRCIVFDDREEFSRADLFPGAEKVILGDFENIGKHITLAKNDYAVIVTRGHLWDLEAWAFALDSPAAYIGVIGSKTKHEFVREKLRERGFESEAINAPRVHAPIGIDIKSESPAEIAVSIAAELVLVRAIIRGKN